MYTYVNPERTETNQISNNFDNQIIDKMLKDDPDATIIVITPFTRMIKIFKSDLENCAELVAEYRY